MSLETGIALVMGRRWLTLLLCLVVLAALAAGGRTHRRGRRRRPQPLRRRQSLHRRARGAGRDLRALRRPFWWPLAPRERHGLHPGHARRHRSADRAALVHPLCHPRRFDRQLLAQRRLRGRAGGRASDRGRRVAERGGPGADRENRARHRGDCRALRLAGRPRGGVRGQRRASRGPPAGQGRDHRLPPGGGRRGAGGEPGPRLPSHRRAHAQSRHARCDQRGNGHPRPRRARDHAAVRRLPAALDLGNGGGWS